MHDASRSIPSDLPPPSSPPRKLFFTGRVSQPRPMVTLVSDPPPFFSSEIFWPLLSETMRDCSLSTVRRMEKVQTAPGLRVIPRRRRRVPDTGFELLNRHGHGV